jgi:hypothetical protein
MVKTMVHPNVKTRQKDEKEIAKAVFLLKRREDMLMHPDSFKMTDKVALEKKVMAIPPNIRKLADERMVFGTAGRKPVLEPERRMKIKPAAQVKVGANQVGSPEQSKNPDIRPVANFLGLLQEELLVCVRHLPGDPYGALEGVVTVYVPVPISCRAATKRALEALISTIAQTAREVRDAEGDTFIVRRSAEEIATGQQLDQIEDRRQQYGAKILSHGEERGKSKTVFGKEYERGRMKHYRDKRDALPTRGDVDKARKDAARQRNEKIETLTAPLFAELQTKAQDVFAIVGGKDALPEGTDGGVRAVRTVVEAYLEKLTLDLESGT